jgi:hypothetical protein
VCSLTQFRRVLLSVDCVDFVKSVVAVADARVPFVKPKDASCGFGSRCEATKKTSLLGVVVRV